MPCGASCAALRARKPFLAFPAEHRLAGAVAAAHAAADQRLADPPVGPPNEKSESVMESLFHYVAPPTPCGYLPDRCGAWNTTTSPA